MVGIDLGTTNSLVAVMEDGHARTLANELDEVLTPSAVAMADDGELLVGRAARDRLVTDPESGKACFKRDMGLFKEYEFGGRKWSPVECSAVVLKELRRIAEFHLGKEVGRAVITVPAYFHDQQRQATLEAAEIAGLEVDRLINEPTAAALAYGYRASEAEQELLVFDIGGGTFDVTLLEIFESVIEVKASGGVSRLGGEDYTDALAARILDRTGIKLDEGKQTRWRQQIEVAKRRLGRQSETVVSLAGKEVAVSVRDLEEAGAALTARIRPVLKRCLRDAGVEKGSIDDVLLVGGASRMPVITKLVAEEMGRIPNQGLDADQVVALGAAVQSALVQGHESVEDIVLTDVCPHTLGVAVSRQLSPNRIEEGYFSPLIDRNTVIPVSRADIFHTLHPQQNEFQLKVYQGESRRVCDNRKIGEIRIPGMRQRPGQKRPGEVEIRFSYDMNGILEVEATILHSQRKISKVFEQRPGNLTRGQIEEAIKRLAPLKIHPRDKLPNRARLERGQRLFEDLSGPARDQLSGMLDRFEEALESQDAEQIKVSAAVLDSFMNPFFKEEGEEQPS